MSDKHVTGPIQVFVVGFDKFEATGRILAELRRVRKRGVRIGTRRARSNGRGGLVTDGVAGFEPRLHVGEPVLERLVRRQRAPERIPVQRPLDGEVEHRFYDADHLGTTGGPVAKTVIDILSTPRGGVAAVAFLIAVSVANRMTGRQVVDAGS